jgi:hypothetical protein
MSKLWKNEKTKLVATWIVNTPDIEASARNFATKNKNMGMLFRAWIKSEGLASFVTPEGISLSDPDLHFGELSDVLWTLTV